MTIHTLQANKTILQEIINIPNFAEYPILRNVIRQAGEYNTAKCRQTPYARLSANIIADLSPRRI